MFYSNPSQKASHKLARNLFELPCFTATDVTEQFNVSRQTACNAIEEVESDGLVVEVTG
jgi:Fic family protein